jgi:hypothetical protein
VTLLWPTEMGHDEKTSQRRAPKPSAPKSVAAHHGPMPCQLAHRGSILFPQAPLFLGAACAPCRAALGHRRLRIDARRPVAGHGVPLRAVAALRARALVPAQRAVRDRGVAPLAGVKLPRCKTSKNQGHSICMLGTRSAARLYLGGRGVVPGVAQRACFGPPAALPAVGYRACPVLAARPRDRYMATWWHVLQTRGPNDLVLIAIFSGDIFQWRDRAFLWRICCG